MRMGLSFRKATNLHSESLERRLCGCRGAQQPCAADFFTRGSMSATTIYVDARFNGPPHSGNGGYAAGLIAGAAGANVSVRLLQAVPLNRPLSVAERSSERWEVRDGEHLIATAARTSTQTDVPLPPSYLEALEASKHYAGFSQHIFASCFVCGTARQRDDGLRIFPGFVPGTGVVAAPWMPGATLDDGTGKVRPEFIWAALDCPGYFASFNTGTLALLGELSVHIDRLVHLEEPCVVIGWRILLEGRKCRAGTALFDEDGERCALGVATWVERSGA
jgi:hypothetical protein